MAVGGYVIRFAQDSSLRFGMTYQFNYSVIPSEYKRRGNHQMSFQVSISGEKTAICHSEKRQRRGIFL